MFNIFKKFAKSEKQQYLPEIEEITTDILKEHADTETDDLKTNNVYCKIPKNNEILNYFEKRQAESNKIESKLEELIPAVEDISETEEYDFVIETEESKKEDFFSIEQLATEDFQGQELEEISETEEKSEPLIEESSSKGLFGITFAGLKEAVSKTSEYFSSNILSLAVGKEEIDDDLLDEMEEKFIRADIGVDTTVYIIERLRENKNKIKTDKLGEYLKNEFKEIIKASGCNNLNLKTGQLNTFLITGVNGAGKTTLIGKLAYRFKLQGKKVLVAAGDTFRAAAEDQLEIWANRAGADIVRQDGADPASVVFDSIKKAKSENYDILLIDTAGRLHNKFNLMEELKKIKKVIDKEAAESLVESILVLDATTGQNGLKQAEIFKEAVNLTCVGLTKLDGTAKGGVILGISKELNLPVKLIGIGEKMEDLKDFNADDFIEVLF